MSSAEYARDGGDGAVLRPESVGWGPSHFGRGLRGSECARFRRHGWHLHHRASGFMEACHPSCPQERRHLLSPTVACWPCFSHKTATGECGPNFFHFPASAFAVGNPFGGLGGEEAEAPILRPSRNSRNRDPAGRRIFHGGRQECHQRRFRRVRNPRRPRLPDRPIPQGRRQRPHRRLQRLPPRALPPPPGDRLGRGLGNLPWPHRGPDLPLHHPERRHRLPSGGSPRVPPPRARPLRPRVRALDGARVHAHRGGSTVDAAALEHHGAEDDAVAGERGAHEGDGEPGGGGGVRGLGGLRPRVHHEPGLGEAVQAWGEDERGSPDEGFVWESHEGRVHRFPLLGRWWGGAERAGFDHSAQGEIVSTGSKCEASEECKPAGATDTPKLAPRFLAPTHYMRFLLLCAHGNSFTFFVSRKRLQCAKGRIIRPLPSSNY